MADDNRDEELRRHSRLNCILPVNYRLGKMNEVHGGLLLDLGAGGLKLELEMEGTPEVPTPIAVVLRLPGENNPIRVDGTAVAVADGKQPWTCWVRVVFNEKVVEETDSTKIRDYVEDTTELLLGKAGAAPETFGRKMGVKEFVEMVDGMDVSLDNEKDLCILGDILSFNFNKLDGQPPMTVGAKIGEMLAVSLVEKYGVDPAMVDEALGQCRAKLNDIGKRYFMNMVRRKVSGEQ